MTAFAGDSWVLEKTSLDLHVCILRGHDLRLQPSFVCFEQKKKYIFNVSNMTYYIRQKINEKDNLSSLIEFLGLSF